MNTTGSAADWAKPISLGDDDHRHTVGAEFGDERAGCLSPTPDPVPRWPRRRTSPPVPWPERARSPPAVAAHPTASPARHLGLVLQPDPVQLRQPQSSRACSARQSLAACAAPASTLSSTLRCGNRLKCWKTIPMRCRNSIRIVAPAPIARRAGCRRDRVRTSRFSVRNNVDLPDPTARSPPRWCPRGRRCPRRAAPRSVRMTNEYPWHPAKPARNARLGHQIISWPKSTARGGPSLGGGAAATQPAVDVIHQMCQRDREQQIEQPGRNQRREVAGLRVEVAAHLEQLPLIGDQPKEIHQ